MSHQEYYEDQDSWGSYSYVTLKEVVNNYLMGRDDSDSTALTPRYKVLFQAKRGIRELNFDVSREIKAQELELSPTLTITLPHDYVSYVRISWVDDNGKLHPFAEDNKMSVANVYLQDNDFELLYDESGNILEGSKSLHTDESTSEDSDICHRSFIPNVNMSENYPNGRFKVDVDEGVIRFGSSAEYKNIVLEYITDGLYDSTKIRVNKLAEEALYNFIYYQLIKNKSPKSMALNEKMRARKEWYNSRRIAKRRINPIRKENLTQAMKGSSVWIKK